MAVLLNFRILSLGGNFTSKNIAVFSNTFFLKKAFITFFLNPVFSFKMLVDLYSRDMPGAKKRFILIYILSSFTYTSLKLKFSTLVSTTQSVPSLIRITQGFNWPEREVWDMMGVTFFGNTDLRRLLTDYGFDGHPLKKDFPLTGYKEIYYNDTIKRLVTEKLELAQEYRDFGYYLRWNLNKEKHN